MKDCEEINAGLLKKKNPAKTHTDSFFFKTQNIFPLNQMVAGHGSSVYRKA